MILNLCILRMFEDNFTYGAANKTFIHILNDVKIMHGFGNDLFQGIQADVTKLISCFFFLLLFFFHSFIFMRNNTIINS